MTLDQLSFIISALSLTISVVVLLKFLEER
jgi:hypothetical protein